MRLLGILVAISACAVEEPPQPSPPQPIDVIWQQTIRPGTLLVAVPGTGAYDLLGAPIEALGGGLVDVRMHPDIAGNAITLEQAIAAAHRAGLTNEELEAGAVTFGIWGSGITHLDGFDYLSYEGVRVHFVVLGGTNACASGQVFDHLLDYNETNADKDARDLYLHVQAWIAAHDQARDVVVMSHSWGGAVSEYLALNLDMIQNSLGPLADASLSFTVAAGVPGAIVGFAFPGPGLRDRVMPTGRTYIYETDRPDDPVHNLNPSGNIEGHQYSIVVGDEFRGSYGITTLDLSCTGVPGPCTP